MQPPIYGSCPRRASMTRSAPRLPQVRRARRARQPSYSAYSAQPSRRAHPAIRGGLRSGDATRRAATPALTCSSHDHWRALPASAGLQTHGLDRRPPPSGSAHQFPNIEPCHPWPSMKQAIALAHEPPRQALGSRSHEIPEIAGCPQPRPSGPRWSMPTVLRRSNQKKRCPPDGWTSCAIFLLNNDGLSGMNVNTARAEDCHAVAVVHVESRPQACCDVLPAQYLASLSVAERGDSTVIRLKPPGQALR